MVVQLDHELNQLNMGVLAWFPMSIYVGPCPPLGTSCSTCLIVTNRSHTSRCTTTISCYQTRLASSLLTPSRDTHTYRRSLPTYQSRNKREVVDRELQNIEELEVDERSRRTAPSSEDFPFNVSSESFKVPEGLEGFDWPIFPISYKTITEAPGSS